MNSFLQDGISKEFLEHIRLGLWLLHLLIICRAMRLLGFDRGKAFLLQFFRELIAAAIEQIFAIDMTILLPAEVIHSGNIFITLWFANFKLTLLCLLFLELIRLRFFKNCFVLFFLFVLWYALWLYRDRGKLRSIFELFIHFGARACSISIDDNPVVSLVLWNINDETWGLFLDESRLKRPKGDLLALELRFVQGYISVNLCLRAFGKHLSTRVNYYFI